MSEPKCDQRIPPEVLEEQWYRFVHHLIEGMQTAFRNAQGDDINQKKMASRLGKKPSFISRCLSGQINMTIRTIHDLARAMDCRLEVTFKPLKDLRPANHYLEEAKPELVSALHGQGLAANTAAFGHTSLIGAGQRVYVDGIISQRVSVEGIQKRLHQGFRMQPPTEQAVQCE
jgi:hypothetical protein